MIDWHTISEKVENYSFTITLGAKHTATLRPLMQGDVDQLSTFLQKLSTRTRLFFTYDSFDRRMAETLCADINKYDKLRFMLETDKTKEIIGIFEFSMDLVPDDIARYQAAGIKLDVPKVCRYGPALLDEFQGKGLGQAVFAKLVPVIRETGKDTIILFGGVKSDNTNAIRHYAKLGFEKSAEFSNQSGEKCLDMVLRLV